MARSLQSTTDRQPAAGATEHISAAPVPGTCSGGQRLPAFDHRLDAVVLAGTHEDPRRLVNGRNKAFLEIGGRSLVRHVVDALLAAESIDRIYVVGPATDLARELVGDSRVHCVEQEGRFLSNSWAGIRAVEAGHPELDSRSLRQRPVLMTSCDLPLATAAGIDDFVARCAATDEEESGKSAVLVGVCEKSGLEDFYGSPEHPGIERPLVQLSEGEMRLANIYVARPRLLSHSEFLQTSFSLRKAKDWRNVLRLVLSLFGQHGGWSAAWMTCRLQLTAMLGRRRGLLYWKLREGNTMDRVERGVGTVLGGLVRVVVTPFGGLSLDVDDEDDFRLLSENYERWMAITRDTSRATEAPRTPGCWKSGHAAEQWRP